jgi:hypothetical protein
MRSRPTGAFAGTTVTTGPFPSPTPIPLGNPSGLPIPLPIGNSGGAVKAVSLPGNNVAINGRVAIAASTLDGEELEDSLRTCTNGNGGFGNGGIQTFGASKRNGTASGWSKGSAITTPATTTCKPTEASVDHR